MTKHELLTDVIGDISQSPKVFFTEGRWSSYHLLSYLLSKTGEADVYISTFSYSEEFIRTVMKLKSEGLIRLSFLYANVAVKGYKSDINRFVTNVFYGVFIGNFHEKMFYIKSKTHRIGVIQTANATPNPSYESGIIFSGDDADCIMNQFTSLDLNSKMI